LETRGVIIEIIRRTWNNVQQADGSVTTGEAFCPVVQFVDQRSGRKITFESVGRGEGAYHVEQEVAVLYDPENPSNVKIKSFIEIWSSVVILTVLCGIFLTVGLLILAFT
jgi:hypothetical protein